MVLLIGSPVWHFSPLNPTWQLQEYPLIPSMQLPPFSQGLLTQSSMSKELNEIINKFDNEM